MALPDLATEANLSTRGVDVSNTALVAEMLAVASAIVRGAAASPILEATSTVSLTAWGEQSLRLPGLPVSAVATVEVDGVARTDWTLTDSSALWSLRGWGLGVEPGTVEVTMTHGLPAVPAEIRNLVCDLAALGIATAADGAHDVRVVAERIDDYSVEFAQGAEVVASAMTLPPLTRSWLRARFGGGVAVVTYR